MHFSIKRLFLLPQSISSTDHPRSRTRSWNHPPPLTTPSSPDETMPRNQPPEKNQKSREDKLTRHTIPALRFVQRSYLSTSTIDTLCPTWSENHLSKQKKPPMRNPKEKKVKVQGPRIKHWKAIHKPFPTVSARLSKQSHGAQHQS